MRVLDRVVSVAHKNGTEDSGSFAGWSHFWETMEVIIKRTPVSWVWCELPLEGGWGVENK